MLRVPTWVAPNLITLIGFTATVLSTTVLILQDLNCEGKVNGDLQHTVTYCVYSLLGQHEYHYLL